MGEQPIYKPGIRGWWAFAYRYSPRGADRREFVTDFLRRARPSARLRQSEVERAFYQRAYYEAASVLSGQPEADRARAQMLADIDAADEDD